MPTRKAPTTSDLSAIRTAVNKGTVALQRDTAQENESNWLPDFNQVRGSLNKLTPMFTFSWPPLVWRNRDF